MNQKWNLQDIRPAGAQKPVTREAPAKKPAQDIAAPRAPKQEEYRKESLGTIRPEKGSRGKKKPLLVTIGAVLLILVAGFFVNMFLGGAEVTVHPKYKDVSVGGEFSAFTNPAAGQLGYELLTLEATGERQVQASGKETVSLRAEGKITVYNENKTSQRLIKNTRFEDADGKIFRIEESIEVPAATTGSDGNAVPGTVVADVFADATGEEYNVEPRRFTLPGLEGTDQFDTVYGQSMSAFTGGFDGEKYIIDDAELTSAQDTLHAELRDKLIERLKEERPAGFVVYDAAVTFAYNSLPSTEYGDSLATIKENAKLQIPIFRESEFAEFISRNTIPEYKNEPVTIANPGALTFTYASGTTEATDIASNTSINFSLEGDTRIIWKFDEKKLQDELVSIKKNAATSVFGTYPSISHAQAEVRPFWASQFPDKASDIKIKTVVGE